MGMIGTRRGSRRWTVLVAIFAALALVATACGSEPPPSGSGTDLGADCVNPPNFKVGALLAGCYLAGFDLSGMDLTGANLQGANLEGTNLSGANLRNANLEGANLTGADLSGTNLTGAILSGAILLGAIFINALLEGALFGFGTVYGPDGNGGETPAPESCSGPYCPGYNSATTNFTSWLCLPSGGGGDALGVPIVQSQQQLEASGKRSVVTDSNTDFTGAKFLYDEDAGVPFQGLDLRDANFTNTEWRNANFACQSLDGARFSSAHMTVTGFHSISAHNANFDDSEFNTTWTCEADFKDSTFKNTVWAGLNAPSCPEFSPTQVISDLDDPLVSYEGVDFTNSTINAGYDPNGRSGIVFTYDFEGVQKKVSFVGAKLDGATFGNGALFWRADFTGSTANGTTFVGPNDFTDAVFPATGWENATFTTLAGYPIFDGASCPDGSTGSNVNPCFVVNP